MQFEIPKGGEIGKNLHNDSLMTQSLRLTNMAEAIACLDRLEAKLIEKDVVTIGLEKDLRELRGRIHEEYVLHESALLLPSEKEEINTMISIVQETVFIPNDILYAGGVEKNY